MRRLFFRWAAAALLAGALMIPAAEAAQLQIDDRIVEPSAAWTEEGTPYVTLAALCQAADGYTLSWNGTAAALTAEDLELTATPGALYVEVNGRALYVEHGVQVRDGRIALPLEVLAEAAGLQLTWDEVEGAAWLSTDQAQPGLCQLPGGGPVLAVQDYLGREPGGTPAGPDRGGQRDPEPGGEQPVPRHCGGGGL